MNKSHNKSDVSPNAELDVTIEKTKTRPQAHDRLRDMFINLRVMRKGCNPEQDVVNGDVPLIPMQHWLFRRNIRDLSNYNEAFLCILNRHLPLNILEVVVKKIVLQHDALRLRFTATSGFWMQYHVQPDDVAPVCSLEVCNRAHLLNRCGDIRRSLNISDGPVIRFTLFNLGSSISQHLLVVVHHLVFDAFSWKIIRQDIERGIHQAMSGQMIEYGLKTTSFKQWSLCLQRRALSPELENARQYWATIQQSNPGTMPTIMRGLGNNTYASLRTLKSVVKPEDVECLASLAKEMCDNRLECIIMAALGGGIQAWSNQDIAAIDLTLHGRDPGIAGVDLTRTVGYITMIAPIILRLPKPWSIGTAIEITRNQMDEASRAAVDYGVLRYLAPVPLEIRIQPEIKFNYFSKPRLRKGGGGLLQLVTESIPLGMDGDGYRHYILNVDVGSTSDGSLIILWRYSCNCHEDSSIAQLADGVLSLLKCAIYSCVQRRTN